MPCKRVGQRLGVRQRLGPIIATKPKHDPLSKYFLHKYAEGALSARDVCEGSASAGPKGSSTSERLGKVIPKKMVLRRGKTLVNSKHCARSVKRAYESEAILYKPLMISVPIWDEVG